MVLNIAKNSIMARMVLNWNESHTELCNHDNSETTSRCQRLPSRFFCRLFHCTPQTYLGTNQQLGEGVNRIKFNQTRFHPSPVRMFHGRMAVRKIQLKIHFQAKMNTSRFCWQDCRIDTCTHSLSCLDAALSTDFSTTPFPYLSSRNPMHVLPIPRG